MKNELENLGLTIVDETENFFYMKLEADEDEALRNASEEIKENLIFSYRKPAAMGELRDYDYKFHKNL